MDISWIEIIMSGVVRGGIYALMSMGLTLVLGVMNIPSFCHSEFYMLGAFCAFFAFSLWGLPPLLAILAATLIVFALGIVVERVVLVPLRKRSGDDWWGNAFMVTVGLSSVMLYSAQMLFGTTFRGIDHYWQGTISIAGSMMSIDRFVGVLIAFAALAFFWFFIQWTKPGRSIRAASQNPRGAMLAGINLEVVYDITFALSCALAAVAGACLLALNPAYPAMGATAGTKAWLVVILVGFGNLSYCLFGGIILGMIEALSYYFLGAGWQDVISLACVVLILLIKPSGLFAKKVQGIWGQ